MRRGKFPFTVSHCELVYQIRAVVVSMCIVGIGDTFQVDGARTRKFLDYNIYIYKCEKEVFVCTSEYRMNLYLTEYIIYI